MALHFHKMFVREKLCTDRWKSDRFSAFESILDEQSKSEKVKLSLFREKSTKSWPNQRWKSVALRTFPQKRYKILSFAQSTVTAFVFPQEKSDGE